jgi:hypothetical protein
VSAIRGYRSKRVTHRATPGPRDWLRPRVASSPSGYCWLSMAIGWWRRRASRGTSARRWRSQHRFSQSMRETAYAFLDWHLTTAIVS